MPDSDPIAERLEDAKRLQEHLLRQQKQMRNKEAVAEIKRTIRNIDAAIMRR